jgi:acyl carrier protein
MNDKLKQIMVEVLQIEPSLVGDDMAVGNQPKWDSLRHMNLIFAIEDGFGIRFADEELSELTSVAAIERSLAAKQP